MEFDGVRWSSREFEGVRESKKVRGKVYEFFFSDSPLASYYVLCTKPCKIFEFSDFGVVATMAIDQAKIQYLL